MVAVDLFSADLGRVAGQSVNMLRVANQIVWQAPGSENPSFSIFNDSTALEPISSYNDITWNSFLANQFHLKPGPDLEIVSVGLYVPADSWLLGQSGVVGVQSQATAYLQGAEYDFAMIPSEVSTDVLVEGWNWTEFPTPIPWTSANPFILAGYYLGSYYLYNNVLDTASIPASGLNFELMHQDDLGEARSWFVDASLPPKFRATPAKSYGIDVRARIPV